jgi:hypothetical protein
MKPDKTEIARRQLGTALALFIEDRDPVSVHTLACAGCEIAEYLTPKSIQRYISNSFQCFQANSGQTRIGRCTRSFLRSEKMPTS